MSNIIASALLGAVGGAVGALVGTAVQKEQPAAQGARTPFGTIGGLAGAMIAVAIASSTGLKDRLADFISPPSALERFGRAMLALPGVKERVAGKTQAEVQAITHQLSAAGVVKLSDSDLLARVRLVQQMLDGTTEAICGRFVKGSASQAEVVAIMNVLPAEPQGEWFALLTRAVQAEVSGEPGPQLPTQDELTPAMAKVLAQFPEPERAPFAEALGKLATMSDEDACRTSKQLNRAVLALTGPEQALVARALVMQ